MKYFIYALIISLVLSISVFADDPPPETWDLSLEELYNEGLVSDELMEMQNEDNANDYAVPTQTATYDGRSDLDSTSSYLVLAKQEENKALDSESGESLKSLSPVPSSGSAYSDPTLISVEYAEDAEQGSLLEVIYGLLGKPVKAYHYRWQSNTQGYNVYSVQVLDYDIPWIASFLMLLLVIYCIFKAGGALLSKL